MPKYRGFLNGFCRIGVVLFFMLSAGTADTKAACVAEYLMEEGQNSLVGDTSGAANNAYFVGAPQWTEGHSEASAGALQFDGSVYMEIPDSASLDQVTGGFSMAAWIYVGSAGVTDTIVWKVGAFRIWRQNTNLLVTLEGVSTVSSYQLLSGLLTPDTWMHVAVTYDGTYLAGYVNGVRIRRVRVNSSPISISTSNYPLRVAWNGGAPHFQGKLDAVRLYSHALAVTDVAALMDTDMWSYTPLTVVQNGLAAAAIVIPNSPKPVESYAAQELQYHIQKASGATLAIYTEANKPAGFPGLIYVGACSAAAAAGIQGDYLDDNTYILKNFGTDYFFAGNDNAGEPLGMLHLSYTRIGSMLAVYHFLENAMQVKWLWPGTQGEVIPACSTISANESFVMGQPYLRHTRLNDASEWNWNGTSDYNGWTSLAARDAYLNEQSVWMRRQGFCRSISLEYNHAFGSWWTDYSATHPEYFNLLPDGTRRSDPYYWGGYHTLVSMCLSEPAFHRQIIDNWQASGASGYINCAENDTATKCTCPNCMAWDVPDPDVAIPWEQRLTYATNAFNNAQPEWYTYLGSMSDRFAKYLLAVQAEAQARGYADAAVIGYAYANYVKAPLTTALNDHVIIGIVPASYFPWTEQTQQAFREQWSGWSDTAGAQVFLRPNYFLDGHNMPIFFAHRFGSDFLYALRRNMIGTIFDTLTGQWGSQAANLYMLARVQTHVDPDWQQWGSDLNGDGAVNLDDLTILANQWLNLGDCGAMRYCADINRDLRVDLEDFQAVYDQWNQNDAQVEAILDEFYSAFGPAKNQVRAYFAHWQAVSDAATTSPHWAEWFVLADEIFTPAVMATGRTLLTQAQTAAVGDTAAVRLTTFLEKGLTNAELTLAAQKAWEYYQQVGTTASQNAWLAAINQLDTYRASIEADDICNMAFLRWAEDRVWDSAARAY